MHREQYSLGLWLLLCAWRAQGYPFLAYVVNAGKRLNCTCHPPNVPHGDPFDAHRVCGDGALSITDGMIACSARFGVQSKVPKVGSKRIVKVGLWDWDSCEETK